MKTRRQILRAATAGAALLARVPNVLGVPPRA